MGRPTIGKRAMTDAERQRRRRKRVRREAVLAEKLAKRAENEARFAKQNRDHPIYRTVVLPVSPPLDDKAEELASQLLDILRLDPDLTVASVQAAITRLAGVEFTNGDQPGKLPKGRKGDDRGRVGEERTA